MLIPFYFQDNAVNSLFNYFEKNNGNPLVVMPTGTGKSVVIAMFVKRALELYPSTRIMMLTHVKELISQNAVRIQQAWPTVPLGIYSAGLKSRDTLLPITYGGIASVKNDIKSFPKQDLLLVDESHLISPNGETTYRKVIDNLKEENPFLKTIGFTATPYRLKHGMLTENHIFDDICFDLSGFEDFNRLIAEGFLSDIISPLTTTKFDYSGVGISSNGDYKENELDEAISDEELFKAVQESVDWGLSQNRKCWLSFAPSIKKAETIAAMYNYLGVPATFVHSKLKPSDNDERIKAYIRGEFKMMVNKDKLTTGFDHKAIDLLANFRPSLSPGLWVQMLGRGTRCLYAPGYDIHDLYQRLEAIQRSQKQNLLVLDFTSNTENLGPINDPVLPRKPGQKRNRDAPIKLCPKCPNRCHASVRVCNMCGYEFPFNVEIFNKASTAEVIKKTNEPILETVKVERIIYCLHEKKDSDGNLLSPPSIKVCYYGDFKTYYEWVCLEHPGLVGKKSREWWRMRHSEEPPITTEAALLKQNELIQPKTITVHVNKKPYPEIISHEF